MYLTFLVIMLVYIPLDYIHNKRKENSNNK